MKNKYCFLIAFLVLTGKVTTSFAQPKISSTRINELKKDVVNTKGDTASLNAYVREMRGGNLEEVAAQFDTWSQMFPGNINIPLTIGETLYAAESPLATPYLNKVLKKDSNNVHVLDMIAIDAERWGNKEKVMESRTRIWEINKSRAANALYELAGLYQFQDPVAYKNMMIEVADKFPGDVAGAYALHIFGLFTSNPDERLFAYEQLRQKYDPFKFLTAGVGMFRLVDTYIERGSFDKAIELAAFMSGDKGGNLKRFGFPVRLKLSQDLANMQKLISDGKGKEAEAIAKGIVLPPQFTEAAQAVVVRIQAQSFVAAGDVKSGYDSLVAFQAKRPSEIIKSDIEKLGRQLGKSVQECERDIISERSKYAYDAPLFELEMFDPGKKFKLVDYKGKVVLLSFFFPGCGPCRGEMPHFENALKMVDRKDVVYVSINVEADQNDYVNSFVKGTGYTFTPLKGTDKVTKDYKVRYSPTNFLIDKNGKVQYHEFMADAANEKTIQLMIQSLLDNK